MDKFRQEFYSYVELFNELKKIFDPHKIETEITEIERQVASKGFWNTKNSIKIMKRLDYLQNRVKQYNQLIKEWHYIKDMCELSIEVSDFSVFDEIKNSFESFKYNFDKLNLETKFSADGLGENNAIIILRSNSQDEKSQEFIKILIQKYSKWGENQGFNVLVFSEGIQEAVFRVIGKFAYGYLKSEKGMQKFSSINKLTNEECTYEIFVDVISEIEDLEELNATSDDYLISQYLTRDSEGCGSCSFQIVHIPTGINVWFNSGDSQREKKALAIKIINSKVLDLMRNSRCSVEKQ